MKKSLYQFIFFRIMGWKILGSIDKNIKKCVLMVMHHTSWHEFYLGIFTRGITQIPMHYIAKKELFGFPFGWYFAWMGGKPIDRTKNLNKVEAISKIFDNYDELRLAIFPEGTRKKVTELKSGFYYIAEKANVPIVPIAFDFGKKEVRIGKPFDTTGNYDEDLKILLTFVKGTKGKVSENGFEINI
jgi:1-acyl-sn-glycerol-3-phosphate acyltransferase